MRINYSLRFPTRDAAEKAASVLAAKGYQVTWGIDAEGSAESSDEVEEAREQMQSLAEQLDGHFLGNGGFLRLPPDDH